VRADLQKTHSLVFTSCEFVLVEELAFDRGWLPTPKHLRDWRSRATVLLRLRLL